MTITTVNEKSRQNLIMSFLYFGFELSMSRFDSWNQDDISLMSYSLHLRDVGWRSVRWFCKTQNSAKNASQLHHQTVRFVKIKKCFQRPHHVFIGLFQSTIKSDKGPMTFQDQQGYTFILWQLVFAHGRLNIRPSSLVRSGYNKVKRMLTLNLTLTAVSCRNQGNLTFLHLLQ